MKIIKLFLIAVAIIGIVIGGYFIVNGDGSGADKPKFVNKAAKERMEQIDALCNTKENNWSVTKYENLAGAIWQEYTQSNGKLISLDEATNLKEYLFNASTKLAWDKADALFKQKSYPAAELKRVEEMTSFLSGCQKDFSPNTNLQKAAGICSQWRAALSASSWSPGAVYSRPLRPYNPGGGEGAIRRVEGLSYYKSHFRNNSELAARLSRIRSVSNGGVAEYYAALERAIEQHYNSGTPSNARLESLLNDQLSFSSLPNVPQSAVTKLENYINNYMSRI